MSKNNLGDPEALRRKYGRSRAGGDPKPVRLETYSGRFERKHVAQVAALPKSHVPWYATSASEPCRVTNVPPKCKVNGKILKQGRLPEPEKRAACARAGGVWEEAFTKENRADKMELEFLSPAQAKLMGTAPGPNLRLCGGDGQPGRLVPVANPAAAKAVAAQFERCVGNDKSRAATCATGVAPSAALGNSFGAPPAKAGRNARGQYSKPIGSGTSRSSSGREGKEYRYPTGPGLGVPPRYR